MIYILGPSAHVSISGAVPSPASVPGRVGVDLDPTNATLPDGTMQLRFRSPVAPTDELPTEIHVFWVVGVAPTDAAGFMALTGVPTTVYPVPVLTTPTLPPMPGVTFGVSPPAPLASGVYLTQSVLGYPS